MDTSEAGESTELGRDGETKMRGGRSKTAREEGNVKKKPQSWRCGGRKVKTKGKRVTREKF